MTRPSRNGPYHRLDCLVTTVTTTSTATTLPPPPPSTAPTQPRPNTTPSPPVTASATSTGTPTPPRQPRITTGNPRVTRRLPVPVPAKTRTPDQGYGLGRVRVTGWGGLGRVVRRVLAGSAGASGFGGQHEGNKGIESFPSESEVTEAYTDTHALDANDDGTNDSLDRVVDKKGGHGMRYIRFGVVIVTSTLPRRATVIARVLLIAVGVAMYWPRLASVGYPGRGGSGSGIGLPARGRGSRQSNQGRRGRDRKGTEVAGQLEQSGKVKEKNKSLIGPNMSVGSFRHYCTVCTVFHNSNGDGDAAIATTTATAVQTTATGAATTTATTTTLRCSAATEMTTADGDDEGVGRAVGIAAATGRSNFPVTSKPPHLHLSAPRRRHCLTPLPPLPPPSISAAATTRLSRHDPYHRPDRLVTTATSTAPTRPRLNTTPPPHVTASTALPPTSAMSTGTLTPLRQARDGATYP
ncbi:hypothetical protein EDB84DRAFT_1447247 [Lactarius hengduanensis]|nr:hypothetical protein EDB84DRAFT_1447247 [Lactarius hengduanensis]